MIREYLNKLVVIKLNGGLGTSMGCHGPKSVIPVRSDLTFLDLTVQQIEVSDGGIINVWKGLIDSCLRVICRAWTKLTTQMFPWCWWTLSIPMRTQKRSSANTKDSKCKYTHSTRAVSRASAVTHCCRWPKISMWLKILRREYIRLLREIRVSTKPIHFQLTLIHRWYPPGHGDFYESFQNSGLLRQFIAEGREYCFLSNIDNLGATVDLSILNKLLTEKSSNGSPVEFVMEVTDKTRADVKGGTLIQYENKLRLLEIAQVPSEHVEDFKSVKAFKFFNTNNIWAKLSAIERVLNERTLNMEIIINHKTLENGVRVIQLETAVGAAMKCFEGAIGINVPRSRFLPVKKTSDLLLVMSNLYSLKGGSLVMSPQRMFPTTPLIKLGDNHFSKVKEFLSRWIYLWLSSTRPPFTTLLTIFHHYRFANIPDIIELDHLTVSGDVTFGKGVSLKVRLPQI